MLCRDCTAYPLALKSRGAKARPAEISLHSSPYQHHVSHQADGSQGRDDGVRKHGREETHRGYWFVLIFRQVCACSRVGRAVCFSRSSASCCAALLHRLLFSGLVGRRPRSHLDFSMYSWVLCACVEHLCYSLWARALMPKCTRAHAHRRGKPVASPFKYRTVYVVLRVIVSRAMVRVWCGTSGLASGYCSTYVELLR